MFCSHAVSSVDVHIECTPSHKTHRITLCNSSLGSTRSGRGAVKAGSDIRSMLGGKKRLGVTLLVLKSPALIPRPPQAADRESVYL